MKTSSIKKSPPSARLLCAASAVALLLLTTPINTLAQNTEATDLLAFAQALKNVYKTNSNTAGVAANNKALTDNANKDSSCDQLKRAKIEAQKAYIANKMPLDPSNVIKGSTCFIDVMDIKIPTEGFGFLGSVLTALSPYLKTSVCNKQADWWSATKSQLQTGDLAGLSSQFNNVVSAVNGTTQVAQAQNTTAPATMPTPTPTPTQLYGALTSVTGTASDPVVSAIVASPVTTSVLSNGVTAIRGFLGLP